MLTCWSYETINATTAITGRGGYDDSFSGTFLMWMLHSPSPCGLRISHHAKIWDWLHPTTYLDCGNLDLPDKQVPHVGKRNLPDVTWQSTGEDLLLLTIHRHWSKISRCKLLVGIAVYGRMCSHVTGAIIKGFSNSCGSLQSLSFQQYHLLVNIQNI